MTQTVAIQQCTLSEKSQIRRKHDDGLTSDPRPYPRRADHSTGRLGPDETGRNFTGSVYFVRLASLADCDRRQPVERHLILPTFT